MNLIDLLFHPQVLLETLLPLLAILALSITIYHKYKTRKDKHKQKSYEESDYQIVRITYMKEGDGWLKTETKTVYGNDVYKNVLDEYKNNIETKYKDGILTFTPSKQYMETFQIIMQEMHTE